MKTSAFPPSASSLVSEHESQLSNEFAECDLTMTIPLDGGDGWLIVFICFIGSSVINGTIFTYFYNLSELKKIYSMSHSESILYGSLYVAVINFFGPLSCSVANCCGFRFSVLLGALLSSTSIIFIFIMEKFIFIILHCLVGGFGTSLLYVCCTLMPSEWFIKKRSYAFSIVSTGLCFGQIIFPYLSHYIHIYTRRETNGYFVLSGVCFVLILLLGLHIQQVPPARVHLRKIQKKKIHFKDIDNASLIAQGSMKLPRRIISTIFNTNTNNKFPSVQKVVGINICTISVCNEKYLRVAKQSTTKNIEGTSEDRINVKEQNCYNNNNHHFFRKCSEYYCSLKYNREKWAGSRPLYKLDAFYQGNLLALNKYRNQVIIVVLIKLRNEIEDIQKLIKSNNFLVCRAFVALMIFSILCLADIVVCSATVAEYEMFNTRVMSHQDITEELSGKCNLLVNRLSFRRVLATMIDPTILLLPPVALLFVTEFIFFGCRLLPYVFIREYGKTVEEGKSLQIYLGLGSLGKIFLSAFINHHDIINYEDAISVVHRIIYFYIALLMVGGFWTIIITIHFNNEQTLFKFYAVCIGAVLTTASVFRSVIIMDIVGLNNLTNAYGLLYLFESFAILVGHISAVTIYEKYKLPERVFQFTGLGLVLSGFIIYGVKFVKKFYREHVITDIV